MYLLGLCNIHTWTVIFNESCRQLLWYGKALIGIDWMCSMDLRMCIKGQTSTHTTWIFRNSPRFCQKVKRFTPFSTNTWGWIAIPSKLIALSLSYPPKFLEVDVDLADLKLGWICGNAVGRVSKGRRIPLANSTASLFLGHLRSLHLRHHWWSCPVAQSWALRWRKWFEAQFFVWIHVRTCLGTNNDQKHPTVSNKSWV